MTRRVGDQDWMSGKAERCTARESGGVQCDLDKHDDENHWIDMVARFG